MTKERLKKAIRKKFGTYSRFAALAHIDYYRLKKDFLDAHKPERSDLVVIEGLLNSTNAPDEFTTELRNALQEAVMASGGVIGFCSKNEKFIPSTLFQILSGDVPSYRRITPTIKQLLDHFEIKH